MMRGPHAIVLLAHGSPDPDWMAPVEATAARMRIHAPGVLVHTAMLEHGRSLAEVAATLAAAGLRRITVIPLFLSPGGRHVKRDVPALVAAVQAEAFLEACPQATVVGIDRDVEALALAALARAEVSDEAHETDG